MADILKLVDDDPLDNMAKLWGYLMSGIQNSPLSQAEKLGCIEFVKHEILSDMLAAKKIDML